MYTGVFFAFFRHLTFRSVGYLFEELKLVATAVSAQCTEYVHPEYGVKLAYGTLGVVFEISEYSFITLVSGHFENRQDGSCRCY